MHAEHASRVREERGSNCFIYNKGAVSVGRRPYVEQGTERYFARVTSF